MIMNYHPIQPLDKVIVFIQFLLFPSLNIFILQSGIELVGCIQSFNNMLLITPLTMGVVTTKEYQWLVIVITTTTQFRTSSVAVISLKKYVMIPENEPVAQMHCSYKSLSLLKKNSLSVFTRFVKLLFKTIGVRHFKGI